MNIFLHVTYVSIRISHCICTIEESPGSGKVTSPELVVNPLAQSQKGGQSPRQEAQHIEGLAGSIGWSFRVTDTLQSWFGHCPRSVACRTLRYQPGMQVFAIERRHSTEQREVLLRHRTTCINVQSGGERVDDISRCKSPERTMRDLLFCLCYEGAWCSTLRRKPEHQRT